MSSDALFFTLPRTAQNRIDAAFKTAASDHVNSPESSLAAGGFIQEHPLGGGFVRDEEQAGGFVRDDMPSTSAGGGFIRDEDEDFNGPTQIPLSKIPSALQLLHLPPDDDEVLAVFRNAATGWASSSSKIGTREVEDGEQFVSKDDWRSVCAVLLENDSDGKNEETEGDVEMADPSGESEDEYRESDEEERDEEDNDDEYIEGPSTSATRRLGRTRRTRRNSSSLSPSPSLNSKDSGHRKLTSRQGESCTDAYALFFPAVPTEKLHTQKIMIKDIQRAAKLLNEKLKAEEMVEMLETFSTSPDKSMNFDDFCRMMVTAKLV